MTSSTSGSLSTSDSTMQRLRGHQTDAATNIAASDFFQTNPELKPNAELGTNVKNSHGPVSSASFAAVEAALVSRGEAAIKLEKTSRSLAADTTVAETNYNNADKRAGDDLNKQML